MHLTLESYLFLKQGQEIHLLQLGISGNLKHCQHPINVMGVVDTFRQDCRADIEKVLIFVEQLYNCTIEKQRLS